MSRLPIGLLLGLAFMATGTYQQSSSSILFPGDASLLNYPDTVPPFNQTALFADWTHLTGPSYSLKLLRLVDALSNASSNPIFSPLAFKLTLLALASVSNSTQEFAINQFLFDQRAPTEHAQFYSANEQETIEAQIKFTLEFSGEAGNGSSSGLRTHLGSLFKPLLGAGEPNYQLCSRFTDGLNPGSVANCVAYIAAIPFGVKNDGQSRLELTPLEEVKLCLAFGITNYFNCINVFLDKPEHHLRDTYPVLTNYSTADLAYHLGRRFHNRTEVPGTVSSPSSTFLHRLSFLGLVNSTVQAWSDMKGWFGVENFRLGHWMDQWEAFQRTHLTTLKTPITPVANELLSIVQLTQKWAKPFSAIGKHLFKLPNGTSVPTEMLSRQDAFAWVNHGPESRTPDGSSHLLLKLPFTDARYSLVLLLPSTSSNVTRMLSELTPTQLTYYLKRLQLDEKTQVKVTLPRLPLSGTYHFGPLLETVNLSSFALTAISPNVTEPVVVGGALKQIVEVNSEGMVESYWRGLAKGAYGWVAKERGPPVDALTLDRPFVYLLVGRYLDLNLKPAFEVLVAGTYNGPEA